MDLIICINGLEMKLLNQFNYKVWKTCMESYLMGEDLWDVVNWSNTSPLKDGSENSSAYKKWKQINAKEKFILKFPISSNLFDRIIKCKSAHDIWRTIDHLFNKKNKARVQILENELANISQGNLSIVEYFLRIKNLCSEISLLNSDEAISEERMRKIMIRGLKPKYISFVTSIQGWIQQLSLEEFENLLSLQELLAKQLTGEFFKERKENTFAIDKTNIKRNPRDIPNSQFSSCSSSLGKKEESFNNYSKKSPRCYRFGKVGHIRRYCGAIERNMAQTKKVVEEEEIGEDFKQVRVEKYMP
ncbi:uncharacterized protein LOC107874256 [Capsicum annuum]|uniref:uncharacterized protein LOC107874256 n=1 Tax=Capsicum annuum TaxID=4072 RepID=UPI001FB05BFB|nr:uncharacterized protein LOC107874256 [Capsicum annuum]